MEKRLFAAVLLSIAFLALWAAVTSRFFPQPEKPKPAVATKTPTSGAEPSPAAAARPGPAASTPAPVVPAKAAVSTTEPARAESRRIDTVIDTPLYTARLTNRGGQLTSFRLKNYSEKNAPVELVRPRPANRIDYPFAIATTSESQTRQLNSAFYEVRDVNERGVRRIRYRYSDGKASVTKEFVFASEYQFAFDVTATGLDRFRVLVGPGIKPLRPDQKEGQFTVTGNGIVQVEKSADVIARAGAPGLQVFEKTPDFIGVEDNYFITALQPTRASDGVFRAVHVDGKKTDDAKQLYAGLNSASGTVAGKAYFGPKETALLDRYGMEEALHYGFFEPIARLLLKALVWIYGATKNYGWAIIVLTIIIKILLYPLQHKSIVSMKKMQRVQPKMNAIRDRYKKAKTDPEQRQKMNTEMMKLYQQEGINPMSGCFPILLQLPILWAFYSLLSQAIELRGADFMLWINDLSAKDPYYITPILMTITMVIQQHITPSTADPMQKRMFLIMSLVFGFIFKDFPSGLVLYWLVQNLLTIIQQLLMNKYWKDHPDDEKPKTDVKDELAAKRRKADKEKSSEDSEEKSTKKTAAK